ncbi:MAG: sulfatase [Pseudomonadota bacterium]|nr:MAG: sulfatase [Pseudomonadota bacterium]
MKQAKTRCRVLLLAVVAFSVTISGCSTGDIERPNIVLITIDTLRADRLGAYGYDRNLTPNLDQLASGSVVFERAVSTAGTTWPAHASMLTGLYPRYHGLRRNGLELADDVPLVTELLAESGYSTGSFVSFRAMHFRGRLDRGFQVASDRNMIADDEAPIRSGDETISMTIDWLQGQSAADSPIFLWVHLFEPHGPYDLTDYSRQWIEETGYDGFLADGASNDELHNRIQDIVSSPENVAAMNALYDGEIKLADSLVGRVLDQLEADDRLENSIVIVASDHGQGLGENGNMGHGATLREDVIHIPLIIRDFRAQGGHRVSETVSAVDFAPTIAEAALGLNLPGVQGRSLLPYLKSAADETEEREVFAEVELRPDLDEAPKWYDADATALYADDLKFVMQHGETEVFDPGRRPSAETRLESPGVNQAFIAYLKSQRTDFLAGEIKPKEVELTDREIEVLKSLGYIQ